MKERIIEFLKAENKSSAQFAEEIGVQPSGISHIISGRNNPSLDFILKMLEKYKYLSSDWLLFGKGTMYKDNTSMPGLFDQTLFDQKPVFDEKIETTPEKSTENRLKDTALPTAVNGQPDNLKDRNDDRKPAIEKIVWFYNDGSFDEYHPRN